MRQERLDWRLVALTGYGLPDDGLRSSAAGFETRLVKPVDPESLLALLRDGRANGVNRAARGVDQASDPSALPTVST